MKERKSLEDYLVKPGEQSPFANLLVDLAFKKAFDPDKPTSRENLVNLLNDLLEPQLKRPIKNVWTRNVAKNLSGSKESRTAIFDLHCLDDMGNLIKIEVQIRQMKNFVKRLAFYASEMVANQADPGDDWNFDVKPTYVVAITRHRTFDDDRIVHRATLTDLESDEQKFRQLTESSKVSNFSKKEFEAYRNMYHKVWDHNALKDSFFEEFADDVNAKVAEGVDESRREIAKRMIANGKLSDEEISACSGLSIEDAVVLRSGLNA